MAAVLSGIAAAADQLSADGGDAAAHAIMTTDTVPKQALAEGEGYTIGGMAKGAGMLAPALATMLVVITTDAEISAPDLQTCLQKATALTFDRIDSDGDKTTNDTVLALASPLAPALTWTISTTNLARGLLESGPSAHRRCRGASHDYRRGGDRGCVRTGRSGGGQGNRPQQSVQVRDLRQRSQLGTSALGDRRHLCRLRGRRTGCHDERRPGLPGRGSR